MKGENRFFALINALMIELIYCWQSKNTEMLRTEAAILIARKHCEKLKQEVFARPFCGDEEEIYYFRHVQPHFTGRLCYYTILYEALVSKPSGEEDENAFWKYELKRYERFFEKHHLSIEYLEAGCTEDESVYFLVRTNRQPRPFHARLYGIDAKLFTAMDYIASALLAEKLYYQYVTAKLATAPA